MPTVVATYFDLVLQMDVVKCPFHLTRKLALSLRPLWHLQNRDIQGAK